MVFQNGGGGTSSCFRLLKLGAGYRSGRMCFHWPVHGFTLLSYNYCLGVPSDSQNNTKRKSGRRIDIVSLTLSIDLFCFQSRPFGVALLFGGVDTKGPQL